MKTLRFALAALAAHLPTHAAAADEPRAVVEAAYEAFAQGDMDRFAGLMAPDIVWNEAEGNPYADLNPYEGPEAVMSGLLSRLAAEWESITVTPNEYVVDGDRVVVFGRYDEVYKATGEHLDIPFVHSWTVADGRLAEFQQYTDTAALVAAMSLAPVSTSSFSQRKDSPQMEHLTGAGVLPAEPALPFSDAVRVGDIVFLSGMIGIRPGTMELVPGGIEAEARQTMDNIAATLDAHGLALADIVKCTVMMEDIAEWGAFNAVYAKFFVAPYPARSAFGADGLALGARVEVECVAVASAAAGAVDEIRAAIAEWVAIYNRNDWSALANQFTEDAVMMPPNAPAATGRAAIAAWEAANEAGFRIALRPDDISIAGDRAIIRGRSCVFIPLEDGAIGVDIGKFLEVRRRQPDGRWLVAQDVFNSDLAPGAELAKACPFKGEGQ